MTPRYAPHFTLAQAHRQPVAVAFDAPDSVTDTGLLTVRDLDQRLGYLAELARRLPDPRARFRWGDYRLAEVSFSPDAQSSRRVRPGPSHPGQRSPATRERRPGRQKG